MYLCYTKTPQKQFYQTPPQLARIYTLAYLFHKLRINQNLTKKALAEKLGVTEQYVYDVERDRKLSSIKYALKCAELFNVNPEWVKRKWFKEFMLWFEENAKKILGIEE